MKPSTNPEKESENEPVKEKINIINSSKNQKIVFSKENPSEKNKNILFACLLCKRKFENEEKLRKHESFSELHKVNLIIYVFN